MSCQNKLLSLIATAGKSAKSVMLKFVFSLQIMEAMALHLESSYEKLYRWSQGRLIAVIIRTSMHNYRTILLVFHSFERASEAYMVYFGVN